MKPIYIILAVLFSISTFSQNKTIVPKKGTIVFSEENIITNNEEYDASIKATKVKMFEELLKSLEIDQKDTLKLNEIKKMSDMVLQEFPNARKNSNRYESHYVFNDTIIKNYKTENDVIIGDFMLINTKTGKYVWQAKIDSTTIYTKSKDYEYTNNNNIVIKEFKNETRMINGYKCFKVVYIYNENSENNDYNFINAQNQQKEFWVTDKIKLLFHPICREKEILEKYYPLEIKEYLNTVKGSYKVYKTIAFNLK